MREMMQKALGALGQRKHSETSSAADKGAAGKSSPERSEDWGMSPEEALKASLVSGYK